MPEIALANSGKGEQRFRESAYLSRALNNRKCPMLCSMGKLETLFIKVMGMPW